MSAQEGRGIQTNDLRFIRHNLNQLIYLKHLLKSLYSIECSLKVNVWRPLVMLIIGPIELMIRLNLEQ
jgi:hypothetical protein